MKRSGLLDLIKRIHRDEQGATMVEWVLIIAAVAVPLLGALVWFQKDIRAWLDDQWTDIKGDDNANYDSETGL